MALTAKCDPGATRTQGRVLKWPERVCDVFEVGRGPPMSPPPVGPAGVFTLVRSSGSLCAFVYIHIERRLSLKRSVGGGEGNADADVRRYAERRLKPVQTLSPSDPRPKQAPFGQLCLGREAAGPPPPGPPSPSRAERVRFAQRNRGGYEEQMLPSAPHPAAHTSLRMTGCKAEPQKLLQGFPPLRAYFQEAVWRLEAGRLSRRCRGEQSESSARPPPVTPRNTQ